MKDEEMITKQKIFRERNLRIRIPTVLISAERFKSLKLNYKHTRKGKGRKEKGRKGKERKEREERKGKKGKGVFKSIFVRSLA